MKGAPGSLKNICLQHVKAKHNKHGRCRHSTKTLHFHKVSQASQRYSIPKPISRWGARFCFSAQAVEQDDLSSPNMCFILHRILQDDSWPQEHVHQRHRCRATWTKHEDMLEAFYQNMSSDAKHMWSQNASLLWCYVVLKVPFLCSWTLFTQLFSSSVRMRMTQQASRTTTKLYIEQGSPSEN